MLLAPSDIEFLRVGATNLVDTALGDLSKDFILSNFALPKLQVAGKNGAWFALNNSLLHIVRELERLGKCDRVKVDVVPLSKVPATVQRGMVVQASTNVNDNNKTADPSRETKRGYEKLPDRTSDETKPDASEEDDDCSSSDCSEGQDKVNSDSDSDEDEDLTCNVCDRSFASARLLARHQQKRRHFGCSVCESLFSSLIMLEQHKEAYDHWSEDEGDSQDSDDGDDDVDDEDGTTKTEEMERLL